MHLSGKTALVLGSATGIGKAIAFALANQGTNVVFTCYDWPERTNQTKLDIERLPGNHQIFEIDLRDTGQIEKLFATIKDKAGALDIFINNIERGGMPIVHGEYTVEQWDLEMDTTLKAKWWAMHYALPLLKKSREGVAVTVSSIAGLAGRSGPAGLIFNDGYAAANRAISSFTETWARQAAPEARVNELMIGFFETRHAEETRGWELLTEEQKKSIRDHILLKRTGKVEEIVQTVLFLVKDATYMTGSIIKLDGGYILGGDTVLPMPEGVL